MPDRLIGVLRNVLNCAVKPAPDMPFDEAERAAIPSLGPRRAALKPG